MTLRDKEVEISDLRKQKRDAELEIDSKDALIETFRFIYSVIIRHFSFNFFLNYSNSSFHQSSELSFAKRRKKKHSSLSPKRTLANTGAREHQTGARRIIYHKIHVGTKKHACAETTVYF
jgi:hypothetical protein